MLINEMQLVVIIGAEGQREENLPHIHEEAWILKGTKADAIYCDAGNGDCGILHINPKSESLETILRAMITAVD
jgi:hypothetical protein